jgi:hypothetical protein
MFSGWISTQMMIFSFRPSVLLKQKLYRIDTNKNEIRDIWSFHGGDDNDNDNDDDGDGDVILGFGTV